MTIHTYPKTKTVDQLRATIMANVAQLLVTDLVRHHSPEAWSIDGNVVGQGGKAVGSADDWLLKVRRIFNDPHVIFHSYGRLMAMRAQLQEVGVMVEIGPQEEQEAQL